MFHMIHMIGIFGSEKKDCDQLGFISLIHLSTLRITQPWILGERHVPTVIFTGSLHLVPSTTIGQPAQCTAAFEWFLRARIRRILSSSQESKHIMSFYRPKVVHPIIDRVYTSQVVQDSFHQQYIRTHQNQLCGVLSSSSMWQFQFSMTILGW